jgi:oxygen-dependent protoporphyrinogen oxidase
MRALRRRPATLAFSLQTARAEAGSGIARGRGMQRRVVIVGGGVTGLTAAYRLLTAGRDAGGAPLSVTVLEARDRLGGNILTERTEGFVLDGGPDAFVAARPEARKLCEDLGLGDRLMGTTAKNRKVYIRQDGVLHPLPEGLVLAIPTRVLPLARSRLFTWRGKARMGLDLVIPRRRATTDESIGGFIRRRLGKEALERLAEPLLGGIYAGDVNALSLAATFPQLAALETSHGSLIRGALAQRAARGASSHPAHPPPSTFQSLVGGMGELVDALVAAIRAAGGTIRTGAAVKAIHGGADGARLRVELASESAFLPADDVILCAPAFVAADAVEGLDRALAVRLREVPYVSTATISLAYARGDVPHALDASGLIIPKGEKRRALAATFVSSKWASRAPDGVALLRIFAGGHRDPEALAQTDAELVAMARAEVAALIGVRATPILERVFRWERANAQPSIGHPARLADIRAAARRHPGLQLCGAAFEGVGIPDCVRQANAAAREITESAVVAEPVQGAAHAA